MLGVLLIIAGIQLFTLGLVGEMIAATRQDVRPAAAELVDGRSTGRRGDAGLSRPITPHANTLPRRRPDRHDRLRYLDHQARPLAAVRRSASAVRPSPTRWCSRSRPGSLFKSYNHLLDLAAERDDLEALVLVHQDAEIVDATFARKAREALATRTWVWWAASAR